MISVIKNCHAYFFEKGIREMEPINLSILVVNCKDYKPSHDWYLCKSGGYFCGVARTPEWPDYDEELREEYNASDDYVLMPECPRMSDEEAADVVKEWCVQNDIIYNDDMDNIETAYRWYYKYDDYVDYDDLYEPSYMCDLCGGRQ